MASLGWLLRSFLLTLLCVPSFTLEVVRHSGGQGVTCSQGLSECTVKDTSTLRVEEVRKTVALEVRDLKARAALCCQDGAQCSLCLLIDTQLHIQPHEDEREEEDEENSGAKEEEGGEKSHDQSASVTVCYAVAGMLPACKRTAFTVNPAALPQSNEAQLSLVVFKPVGVSFGSSLSVFGQRTGRRDVVVPSIDTVCSSDLQERIEECDVVPRPRLTSRTDLWRNWVELQVVGKNKDQVPLMCLQYEENGRCSALDQRTIPLYLVTPCTCLQAWWDEGNQRSRRSTICPFMNHTGLFQENVWRNVSLSTEQGQMNSGGAMLSWNLSAPCRLEGEVWLCHRAPGMEKDRCKEVTGFRKQLSNSTWRQNGGRWELMGAFEEIDLLLSPCVMVKVKGMDDNLSPYCTNEINRWRWSLLVVTIVVLVCLTALIFYFLRNISSIKQLAQTWRYGECVQTGRGHVVLLSPPDAEETTVSELVCRLGSLIRDLGLDVSVDLWSRAELCSLGPLPWLHSRLLRVDDLGGRAVLVLTGKACERTEEWTRELRETRQAEGGGGQALSPYADVFSAALCCIEADQRLGRAAGRFLLVDFRSLQPARRPELLRGLPLFRLPSQTKALLSELGVGGKVMGGNRRRTEGSKGGSYGLETLDQPKGGS